MKRFLALIVAMGILLSLTGCVDSQVEETYGEKQQEMKPTEEKTQPKETKIEETQPQETQIEETQPEETEYPVPPEETDTFTPYLERIKWADLPIYSGPGNTYDFVQTLGEAGTYTIVEEAYDEQGNLWGKLKSGIGWINLTNSRYADGHRSEDEQLLTAEFTDKANEGDIFFSVDESEYAVRLAFTAQENLTYQFCQLVWETDRYEIGEVFTENTLKAGETFVAQVAFPGDLTTYGLNVTGENHNVQYYAIYLSGKDGSLICQAY